MRNKAFTLIEILIALMIFSILATLTTGTLYHAFNTRERLKKATEFINALTLTNIFLQRDIAAIVPRNSLTKEYKKLAALMGNSKSVEFTRADMPSVPGYQTFPMKRIAYFCKKDHLIRRAFAMLDTPTSPTYKDKTLLTGLSKCHFAYISKKREVLREWLLPPDKNIALPMAIQINLSFKEKGSMTLLYPIQIGLYQNV